MKQILNRVKRLLFPGAEPVTAQHAAQLCETSLFIPFLLEVGARGGGSHSPHTQSKRKKSTHTQILFTIQLATVNTAVIAGGNQLLNPSAALQCVQVPSLIPCPGVCARETPSPTAPHGNNNTAAAASPQCVKMHPVGSRAA